MDFAKIKGYDRLDSEQIEWLTIVYVKHMKELDNPEQYKQENISKIQWDKTTQTMDVHFNNGDLIHYKEDGTWFYD